MRKTRKWTAFSNAPTAPYWLGRVELGAKNVPTGITYLDCHLYKSDMPLRCLDSVLRTIQWGLSASAYGPHNNHKRPDWPHRYMNGHANACTPQHFRRGTPCILAR